MRAGVGGPGAAVGVAGERRGSGDRVGAEGAVGGRREAVTGTGACEPHGCAEPEG